MKRLIFLFVVFTFLFIAAIYLALSRKTAPKQIPIKTPIPLQKNLPQSSYPNKYSWDSQKQEKARRSFILGKLAAKLPYTGLLFSLSYDIDSDFFNLVINKNNTVGASEELNSFLKKNGVEEKSWIENLKTSYE